MERAQSVNEAHTLVVGLRKSCVNDNPAGWHLLNRVATRLEKSAVDAATEMMAE